MKTTNKFLCSIVFMLTFLAMCFYVPSFHVSAENEMNFDYNHNSYIEQVENMSNVRLKKTIKHIYEGLVDSQDKLINNQSIDLKPYFGKDYAECFKLFQQKHYMKTNGEFIKVEDYKSMSVKPTLAFENEFSTFQIAYGTALGMFFCDNPECFYLDVEKISLSISNSEFTLSTANTYDNWFIKGFTTPMSVKNAVENVRAFRDNIISLIPENLTVFETVKFVHDYLVDHIEYSSNINGNFVHTIYGASRGDAVCDGYSTTFKYILDKLNINSLVVAGNIYQRDAFKGTYEEVGHMWNYVKLNNKWYATDVTWDDPVVSSTNPSEIEEVKNQSKYNYFLKGSEDIDLYSYNPKTDSKSDFYYERVVKNRIIIPSYEISVPIISTKDYEKETKTTLAINVDGVLNEETTSPITFTPVSTGFVSSAMEYAYSVSTDNGKTWSEWRTFTDIFKAKRTNQNGIYKFRIQTKSEQPMLIVADENTYKVNINIPPVFYEIQQTANDNVSFTIDKTSAEEETLVTLTITNLAEGFYVESISDANFNIKFTKVNETTYTFEMPAGNINLSVKLTNTPPVQPQPEGEGKKPLTTEQIAKYVSYGVIAYLAIYDLILIGLIIKEFVKNKKR